MKAKFIVYLALIFLSLSITSAGFSQWIHDTNPLNVYCLIVHDSEVIAGTYDLNTVWVSTDNGMTWDTTGSQSPPLLGVNSLVFIGSNLFVGTYNSGVWRSTNFGKNWSPANNGINTNSIWGMTAIGSNLIAIGSGIFQSTDSGAHWKKTSDNYTYEASCTPLAAGGSYVYAATWQGLLRSADSGASWSVLLDSTFFSVAASDSNIYASNDTGFFRSSDYGNTWTMASNAKFGLINISGDYILAGPDRTNDFSCYLSTDFGITWIDLHEGHRSTALVISGKNIIKGSNNTGIWYRQLAGVFDDVSNFAQSDVNISLSPNPTNGFITIHNSTANILHVTLSNILSQSVIELAHPNAPEFTLDLSKLPPGAYFARFTLPSVVITRKILKE